MVCEDGEAPTVQDEPEMADTSKTSPQLPVKRTPLHLKETTQRCPKPAVEELPPRGIRWHPRGGPAWQLGLKRPS